MNQKRETAGKSTGGQFAPDTSGAKNIPTAASATLTEPKQAFTPLTSDTVTALRRKTQLNRASERLAYLDALTITYQGGAPGWLNSLIGEFGHVNNTIKADWEETVSLMRVNPENADPTELERIKTEEQEAEALKIASRLEEIHDHVETTDYLAGRPARTYPWEAHGEALVRITKGSSARIELAPYARPGNQL